MVHINHCFNVQVLLKKLLVDALLVAVIEITMADQLATPLTHTVAPHSPTMPLLRPASHTTHHSILSREHKKCALNLDWTDQDRFSGHFLRLRARVLQAPLQIDGFSPGAWSRTMPPLPSFSAQGATIKRTHFTQDIRMRNYMYEMKDITLFLDRNQDCAK